MPIHEDRIRPVLPSEALPPRSDKQDLTAQTQALLDLGVKTERIYTDHGFTGQNKARPGLNQALNPPTWEGLAAVRTGDTLVVSKLDRLARSVPDARQIGDIFSWKAFEVDLRHTHTSDSEPALAEALRPRDGSQGPHEQ